MFFGLFITSLNEKIYHVVLLIACGAMIIEKIHKMFFIFSFL